MSPPKATGFPPRHLEYVRVLKRRLATALAVTGTVTLFLTPGYLRDWPSLMWEFAPLAGFSFMLVLLSVPGTLDEIRVVCILPYFKKGIAPGDHVRGDTFLSGRFVARHCTHLDVIAREKGWEPLCAFGFADDLCGEEIVWHEACRGLQTVSGLLQCLRENPARWAETARIIDDLERIEISLHHACELGVPFCFLLRHGSVASGHEMEVRQGVFAYD